MTSSPRIASVGYLNARPLVYGFLHGPGADLYRLSEFTPAVCAERLRDGEAEIGLIPSIEFQRIHNLRILPGLCIASRRRARSVLLVSRVAAPEIQSVALDSSSRTSAALLRILLARRARHRVEYREASPDLPSMLEECDAALIIGDAALQAPTDGYRVYDLAAEWFEMTGLPFVFAFWAVRPGVSLQDGRDPFLASRQAGMAAIDRIVADGSRRLGLPQPVVEAYLKESIYYDLGAEELRSLWLFYRQAREAGILGELREIAFDPPAGGDARVATAGDAP